MAITKKIHSKANIKQSTNADSAGIADPIPLGVMLPYAGAIAPMKYLFCDGRVLLRSQYPDLFNIIGTVFAIGGELVTQFRLPDSRAKVLMSVNNSGLPNGSNAFYTVRNLSQGQIDGSTGAEVHALTAIQIPGHSHNYSGNSNTGGISANHTHSVPSGNFSGGTPPGDTFVAGTQGFHGGQTTGPVSSNHTHAYSWSGSTDNGSGTGPAGTGAPHNIIQPSLVVNFIIKALN